jgi:hypothetical protein
MPIQKRTVLGSGKPSEQKASAEANPLKATPFAAHTMAKKKKTKTSGFTATTLQRGNAMFNATTMSKSK